MNQPHEHDDWAYILIITSGELLGLWLLWNSILFCYQQTLLDSLVTTCLAGLFIVGSFAAAVQRFKNVSFSLNRQTFRQKS